MRIVWETYQKGVPLLEVPENPTEHADATNYRPLNLSGNDLGHMAVMSNQSIVMF